MIVRRTILRWASLACASGFFLGCNTGGDGAAETPTTPGTLCTDAKPGTFHEREIEVDGEQRYYYLHVPKGYSCDHPAPLFVDFHGTSTSNRPEENYGQDELDALSEAQGFILVRPRSRSSEEGGVTVFRWDQNQGDIARNTVFAETLVGEIVGQYRIDPQRMYASGFSSGTNMAAQLLASTSFSFAGFGFVGGGMWDDPGISTFTTDVPRIYTVTGYRDYMFSTLVQLDDALGKVDFPAENLMNREVSTGHDLYGWHYEEMWKWLDRGEAPLSGKVANPWVEEQLPTTESLLALAKSPTGDLFATGSGGSFFKRDRETAAWTQVGHVGDSASSYCTSICFLPSGVGIAVGGKLYARTEDGGATWERGAAIPEFQRDSFGGSYLNGVACSGDGRVYGGGYWTGVTSADAGKSWAGAEMSDDGRLAQVSSIAAQSGTVVSVGYYGYIGRSEGDGPFEVIANPGKSQWFTGVAAAPNGHFWVVGEAGEILHSADDGKTWERQTTPAKVDLYSVSFADEQVGLAVGLSGTVFATQDGGATWITVPTGVDRFLGAVAFVGTREAVVAGEKGTALRISL